MQNYTKNGNQSPINLSRSKLSHHDSVRFSMTTIHPRLHTKLNEQSPRCVCKKEKPNLYKINDRALTFIQNSLLCKNIQVRVNNTLSRKITIENSVHQGRVLSILRFLIVINDIRNSILQLANVSLLTGDPKFACCHTTHFYES